MPVRGGVPQGTRIGPIASLFKISDLLVDQSRTKSLTGTTVWERCHAIGTDSEIQDIAEEAEARSAQNNMQLNADKNQGNAHLVQ